ncbi:hypothetical protein V1478_006412 [Vespula squamosa]|uniref:Uncharacterized protein n=1 Tax=Vespula squamosa TaxID=30214 RepID=A0ABD2B7S9_VESSQ
MSLTAHSDPKKSNKLYHFTRRAEERATIPGSVREFRLVESVGLNTVLCVCIERSVEEKHVRGRYQWNASTSINGLVSWLIWESVSPEVAKILTIKESEKRKRRRGKKRKNVSHGNVWERIVIIGETIERGCVCEHGTKIRVKFYEEGLSNSRGRGSRRSSTREVKRSSIGSPGWIIKATNDILREVEEKKKENEEEEEKEWRLFSGQLNRSHGIAPWERLQESENLNLLVSRTSCDRRKSMSPTLRKKELKRKSRKKSR